MSLVAEDGEFALQRLQRLNLCQRPMVSTFRAVEFQMPMMAVVAEKGHDSISWVVGVVVMELGFVSWALHDCH